MQQFIKEVSQYKASLKQLDRNMQHLGYGDIWASTSMVEHARDSVCLINRLLSELGKEIDVTHLYLPLPVDRLDAFYQTMAFISQLEVYGETIYFRVGSLSPLHSTAEDFSLRLRASGLCIQITRSRIMHRYQEEFLGSKGLEGALGQWPGDESDSDLLAMLAEIG